MTEARLDLGWLKYISYACAAGSFFFYLALRSRWLPALVPVAKLIAMGSCAILACTTWHVQESNAEQHSPRQFIVGKVASVRVTTNKSGSINDKFQLTLDDGSLSPSLYAEFVGNSKSEQPIHTGDVLNVQYRTWDNVLVAVDEPQGQRSGWHFTYTRFLDPYVWTVGGVSFFMFTGALGGILLRRKKAAASDPAEAHS
jgi:hypothetical protein